LGGELGFEACYELVGRCERGRLVGSGLEMGGRRSCLWTFPRSAF
jgi:hypothetical protein